MVTSETAAGPVPAIEVRDLTKRYRSSEVDALRGVSFTVDEGEIFALLGRNGAGKSTAVRILTTLLAPTAGSAAVVGMDVVQQAERVRRVIGTALQDAALDDLMTGHEHLVLAGRLAGLRRRRAAGRAQEVLEAFGLAAAADRIAGQYSGGMRRRLDVAMALVRRPRVLFLDEPTTGLDPQSRRALWALIRSLCDEGSTVFLTTQYLAEADELSNRVAIVHEGVIAAVGQPRELKDRWATTTLRVQVGGSEPGEMLRRGLADHPVSAGAEGWWVIGVPGGEPAIAAAVARLHAAGVAVERIAVDTPTLEDVFVGLTGTEIESGPASGDGAVTAVRKAMGLGTSR